MRNFSVSILFLFSCLQAYCGEFVDGLWNDKPWEVETLNELVAQNKPDALAEKAYCMRATWNGFSHDGAQEFKLSQAAHQGGSLLGTVLLSRCYLYGYGVNQDDQMVGKYLREALDSKHPLSLNYLSNCLADGRGGYPRNLNESKKHRQEAISQGVVLSAANYCLALYQGGEGYTKNRERAVEYAATWARKNSHDQMFYCILLRGFCRNIDHPALKDEELLDTAKQRVRSAAGLGNYESMGRLAGYLAKRGRPHEAVPLVLQAAQAKERNAYGMLVAMSDAGYHSHNYKSVGQFSTQFQLARLAYEGGNDSTIVAQKVAASYLYQWEMEVRPDKALPILRKELARGEPVHFHLGRVYLFFEFEDHDATRGEAHFIYSTPGQITFSLHGLAEGYSRAPKRSRDLAKARAAALTALRTLKDEVRRRKLTKTLERFSDEITPEEMKRSNALIKSRWPLSQKAMDEAVATLIEYGDLPKGTDVPQVEED